jgi:alkanesulfonate monooxygenase SsuD/methylene tetrahydromethanopterin reductase-like flavin-dependent oxidoreductase (luciferase family)
VGIKVGLMFWASAAMSDVGIDGPDPYGRLFTPETYAGIYPDLIEWAKLSDQGGIESFWITEHHFQREGYQVVPNVLMTGTVLAQHTQKLRFGAMVHPLPTWHPLRFAEDFALADILTGGRMIFGTGRGSVDREARIFGAGVSRVEDATNARNRSQFEEQMEIIKLAWSQPSFSFHGDFYDIPPAGVTNTGTAAGAAFDRITLVPRPTHPVEIWQAYNSTGTAQYAAQHGHKAVVSYVGTHQDVFTKWELFGRLVAEQQQRTVRPGEDRVLVLRTHIGDTREAALEAIRPGHDERFRFLGAQRPIFGYRDQQGVAFSLGHIPTLEDSIAGGGWVVGTADEVREQILHHAETFGLEYLVVELEFPGMGRKAVSDQIERFVTHVMPYLERISVAA